jgi:hypothetical protein
MKVTDLNLANFEGHMTYNFYKADKVETNEYANMGGLIQFHFTSIITNG